MQLKQKSKILTANFINLIYQILNSNLNKQILLSSIHFKHSMTILIFYLLHELFYLYYLILFMKNTITTYDTKELDETTEHQKDSPLQNLKNNLKSLNRAKNQEYKTSSQGKDQKLHTAPHFHKSNYKEIIGKIKKLELPLWNESSTSWTRNISPQHHIPKTARFSSIDEDVRKNGLFLRLNLRKQLDHHTSFAKSKRPDHWFNKQKTGFPSSTTYNNHRFLDNSYNKTLPLVSDKTKQNTEEKMGNNPQNKEFDSIHYTNHANTINATQFKFDELKGRTFYKAKNYAKVYLDLGRNLPYQEQLFLNNSAVGQYQLRSEAGKQKPQYSMRKILTRFNEKLGNSPGPADYVTNKKQQKQRLSTRRGTFTNSHRLDLSKPLNETPGPSGYEIVRYLQNKK